MRERSPRKSSYTERAAMRRAWLVTSRRRRIVRQPVHVRTAAPIGRERIVVRSGSDEQLYARDHGDAKADGELHAKDCKARWKSRPQLVRNKRAVVGEQFYGTVFAMLLGAFRPVDRDREVSPYEDSRAGVSIAAQRRGPKARWRTFRYRQPRLRPGSCCRLGRASPSRTGGDVRAQSTSA